MFPIPKEIPSFQSGFGSVNDIADSIGSLFGFGPEDRTSVLARTNTQMKPIIDETYSILNTQGYDAVMIHIDEFIKARNKSIKKYKSANTKASLREKIRLIEIVRTDIKNQVKNASKKNDISKSQFDNSNIVRTNDVHTQQPNNNKNIMYIAIGVIALLFSKKIFK